MAEKTKKAIWDMKIVRRALLGLVAETESAQHDEQSRHVRGGSRQRDDHRPVGPRRNEPSAAGFGFNLQITLWLWFTVLFANFAEAMAEGRGKAQADALRKARSETMANRLLPDGKIEKIASSKLRSGDMVSVAAGEFIPGDGEIMEGVASVDESAITGESAPVIRESGGDRSAVTGGTRVLSDWIKIKITSNPGETFLDRMIALVEGAERQKTPNEIALNILLAGLTIIFLLAVVTLQPFAIYSGSPQTVFVLVSLLVCLIPTTIGGLLSAIGIAGMDRLVQHNVLAMSGRAVEAAGDVNTLLLDKTGTITLGNRQAAEFVPRARRYRSRNWPMPPNCRRLPMKLRKAARSSCWPKKSTACADANSGRARSHTSFLSPRRPACRASIWTAARSARALPMPSRNIFRAVNGNGLPKKCRRAVEKIARSGGTPLVVAENKHAPWV